MGTTAIAVGILMVGLAVEAADTVRATLEPSTNRTSATFGSAPSRDARVVMPLLSKFQAGFGIEYIMTVLGEPDMDIGGASFLFVYRLQDDTTVQVRNALTSKTVLSITRQGKGLQSEQVIYDATGASANSLPVDPSVSIATLTSTSTTWEARCRAEDALTNCVPRTVLTLLLPHTGANCPSGMIWNSAGRDSERDMPADWQLLYAVRRAWDTQARRLTDAEHKTFWLELLAKAETPGPRVTVIHEFTEHWTPVAEPVLSKLIADAGQELPVRVVAGRCLALHAARSTHDQLVSLLERAGSFAEREQWFDIASDPRHKNEVGEDPQVVRLGFALLAEERKRSSNYVHGAYFIAIKLGNYVGAKNHFQPEMTFWYRGSNGPTEAYFADTVRNAERWWANNREPYAEREARKTVYVLSQINDWMEISCKRERTRSPTALTSWRSRHLRRLGQCVRPRAQSPTLGFPGSKASSTVRTVIASGGIASRNPPPFPRNEVGIPAFPSCRMISRVKEGGNPGSFWIWCAVVFELRAAI